MIELKLERTKVDFPLWREKVDSSLFNYKGTTVPNWACSVWGLQETFSSTTSKKSTNSKVTINFENKQYEGWVTVAKHGRKSPAYRIWFSEDLLDRIKDVFLMSFMRDLESRLRKDKSENIEDKIPFWEFLDIEYDRETKNLYFTAYYTQKPTFPELFKRMIGSPTLHKIDDELNNKSSFRIQKQDWKVRHDFEAEIGAHNVIYTLIDTINKLIYVGEAKDLIKRFKQGHSQIPAWNFYKYNVLPSEVEKHRKIFERMAIRDFATIFENKKNVTTLKLSEFMLANDKIDK